MSRMAVSMTLDAVRARKKDVTRRRKDSWTKLAAADRLTLIEKGMGLPKGAKQVVVCEVGIVSVRLEPLSAITDAEVEREGLAERAAEAVAAGQFPTAAAWFVDFWLRGHGYKPGDDPEVRRIEWTYDVHGPDIAAIARKLTPVQANDLRETTDRTFGGREIITGRPATIRALCRLGLAAGSPPGHRVSGRWESSYRTELGEQVAQHLGGTYEYQP